MSSHERTAGRWPRLLMCWIPEGWDGPLGPGRSDDVEIVYIDRAHGFGLFLMPSIPLA
jgi:hypothetical protein